jgi:KUP system potassium uptake protein
MSGDALTQPVARKRTAALTLAALGVVFGDIGTSPLYTVKECFSDFTGLSPTQDNVLGILSLITWALIIVVTLKYVVVVMRADNRGEGGVLALMALVSRQAEISPRRRRIYLMVGVAGAALFYGDCLLTPAISVLSAVEGLKVATPALQPLVVPVALGVLVALFAVQHFGTAGVGRWFGPITLLWFIVLFVLGVRQIVEAPQVLTAFLPHHALEFALHHGFVTFLALGAVTLAVTGAEALYADMGHFGAKPIRLTWFGLVFPALALNYLGQGALLLAEPGALQNPFYHMFPQWALYPMIVLSTIATVIASQAVISGTYSMTKQAMQLGFLPRMSVIYTSEKEMGQIYVPGINWALLLAVVAAVLGFGSSTALGSAYGIAVTGTMLITTVLTFFVVRYAWHYNWWLCIFATVFFFVIDATFFSANLLKLTQGGWFPLLVGLIIYTIMATWGRGWELMRAEARVRAGTTPLKPYLTTLLAHSPTRVGGTAIFLTPDPDGVPHSLINNLRHNRVLHDRVVFLTVNNEEIPWVPVARRVTVHPLDSECYQITITYGFMDEVDLPRALETCKVSGLTFEPTETSYFLSRATVVPTRDRGMAMWRERLFAVMLHNVGNVAAYLKLPANRVIEVGTRVEI